MRTIRRWIRNWLLRLPGGLGERVVVLRIRLIYERVPFQNWRAKRYAASEGRLVLSELASGKDRCTIIYSGLSYGSLFSTLCIARIIIARGCMTHFILMGGARSDLGPVVTEDFHRDSQIIATRLLHRGLSQISRKMPAELADVCDVGDSGFLLFDDYTRSGRSWGVSTMNLLDWLMAKSSPEVQRKALYTFADFSDSIPELGDDEYISWHCRYNRTVDQGRHTNAEEFLKSYFFLRSEFPKHEIMIVSDEVGCEHYADLSRSLDIDDLLFSKDYSTDFMGDVALIMKSEFFYVFRGGGIACVPICSAMPYVCIQPIGDEASWSRKQQTSWQTESQHYIKIKKHQFVKDRSEDLSRIPSSLSKIPSSDHVPISAQ